MKLGTRIWHKLYCRWYDAHHVTHQPRRAAAWGWLADRAVRWA